MYTLVPLRFRDISYQNTETYIRELFEQMHPDKKLKSIDRRLLKRFGGTLDYNEWKSGKYEYVRLSNVYVTPVKIPYEQVKIDT